MWDPAVSIQSEEIIVTADSACSEYVTEILHPPVVMCESDQQWGSKGLAWQPGLLKNIILINSVCFFKDVLCSQLYSVLV